MINNIEDTLTYTENLKSNEIPEVDFYNAYKDLPEEKWEELTFTDRAYEISNYGRLKSYAINKDGVISKNKLSGGYLCATLSISKKRKNIFIHKLVAEHFVLKDDENKKIVIHLDNDKKNNYYRNLKWVSAKECFEHNEKFNAKLHNGFRKNKTSAAKITKQDAEKIREMIAKGIPQNIIAKLFSISEMQVTRIKRNENWVVEKNKKTKKILNFQKVYSTKQVKFDKINKN